jgi:hypothetical protein
MSFVVKRNGTRQPVHFDKITDRIERLAYGLNREFVDTVRVWEGEGFLCIPHKRQAGLASLVLASLSLCPAGDDRTKGYPRHLPWCNNRGTG